MTGLYLVAMTLSAALALCAAGLVVTLALVRGTKDAHAEVYPRSRRFIPLSLNPAAPTFPN